MEEKTYLQIKAKEQIYLIQKDQLMQVLYEPIITRIPEGDPLVYGILYDKKEMMILLDPTEGAYGRDPEFGKMCMVLCRGSQKIAVAASEIGTEDHQLSDEERQDDPDLLRRFLLRKQEQKEIVEDCG